MSGSPRIQVSHSETSEEREARWMNMQVVLTGVPNVNAVASVMEGITMQLIQTHVLGISVTNTEA
jgi:hypothetical protein